MSALACMLPVDEGQEAAPSRKGSQPLDGWEMGGEPRQGRVGRRWIEAICAINVVGVL